MITATEDYGFKIKGSEQIKFVCEEETPKLETLQESQPQMAFVFNSLRQVL